MHRLIARFLLLVALAANLGPLASAIGAAPLHACCIRKAHQCHDSESEQLIIRDASCCSHDCGRAITTSQWAQAQPLAAAAFAQDVNAYLSESTQVSPNTEALSFQSTRGPPQFPA
jgi:hypothetical protein